MKKSFLILCMFCGLSLCAGAKKSVDEIDFNGLPKRLSSNLKESKNEGLNISIFSTQYKDPPSPTNTMYKWIKDKFGVTFSFEINNGDENRRIARMIATDSLPDLLEVSPSTIQNTDCLLDLKDLIEEYAPNIRRHYDSVWNKMLDIDGGHIYSLPNYGVYEGAVQETYYNQSAFWIQKAVLKEFGYPKITTIDEYFDLIEKYYRKYPTIGGRPTIPFSIITADWEAFNLWQQSSFLAGYPNDGNGHVDKVGDKYIYTDNFTDENAKRWFKLANGYYQRGLIDPASFTDSRDQYYEKVAQGRLLGMFIQGWEFISESSKLSNEGKYERTYAPLPIVFDKSIKPHYRDTWHPNLQYGYGITVSCGKKKAIEILKFMDTMLEEENQRTLFWGFEGIDWQKDKEGRPYRTQKQREQQSDDEYRLNHFADLWAEEAPKLSGSFSDGLACDINDLPWEYRASSRKEDIELWDAYGVSSYAALMDSNPPANPGWYPMWRAEPESGPEIIALNKTEDVRRTYLPNLITCSPKKFDLLWKEYVSEMEKAGIKKYVNYMQIQLDERVKKFGGLPE